MWIFNFADEPTGTPGPEDSSINRPVPQPKPLDGAAPPVVEEEEEQASVGSEVNDVMMTLLPWVTSILFHLGIIVLAMFAAWSYVAVEEDKGPIIPIARLSERPGSTLTQAEQTQMQTTEAVREVATEQVSTNDSLVTDATSQLELVGLSGGGGKVAPLGTVAGAAAEVATKFYGTGGNARKIIYIVDASGSLIDTLPFVVKELKRSINELSDKQQFTVIFFQAGDAIEVPPIGWKQATSEMKKAVADWVTLEAGHVTPRGSTNPVKAIQVAMRYKPELVYILSDNITGKGRYEVDREELLKILNDANKDRKIAINTIQFLYPDPLGTLEAIAKNHGGVFTYVKESDLGLK